MSEKDAWTDTSVVAGRYRLVRQRGRGGMGTARLAEDMLTGRKVALKELRPPQESSDKDRQTHRRRSLQEARSVARFSHPNAVTLYDVIASSTEDDTIYLIMELIDGPTLSQLVMRQGGTLPAPQVARFGLQLVDVMEAAHGLGLVHLDIKPDNILIAPGDQAKLTDFGIADLVGGTWLTGTGTAGTVSFMAPELFQDQPVSAASDIWSLGATLFYAADGRALFNRDNDLATMVAIRDQAEVPAPDCDPALAEAISGMLVYDPGQRLTIPRIREILSPVAARHPGSSPSNSPEPLTAAPPQRQGHAAWDSSASTGMWKGTPTGITTEPSTTSASRPRRFKRWVSGIRFRGDRRPTRDDGQVPPPPDIPASAESGGEHIRRYLKGQCPQTVGTGEPFSVLARVVVAPQRGAAQLKTFGIGPPGRDVLLDLHAPGLQVHGPQRQAVHVPSDGDSEPVMFELEALAPGPQMMEVTAWADGTYLGQLNIETTVTDRRVLRRRQQDMAVGLDTEPAPGMVTLVVRHDPRRNSYRFEFRDEDNPGEVVSDLVYEPGPRVERLVAELDRLAKGRSGYSAAETRDYLVNAGAALWTELLPVRLREQFWERQDRISQLTILADSDVVPWELLYPLDPGHDEGFLVEQFPVTRTMFGCRPARRLRLDPAWFVLPDGSPSQARAEVAAMLNLFYPSRDLRKVPPVVDGLTPLLERIEAGDFGLLHFACHNAFDPADGSSIMLDRRQLTPTLLTTAAIGQVLAGAGPTVFINACRSAGASPSYHRLDGWARKFLDAGAAAFIGSLWAVRDSTAQDFAAELYRHLQDGETLGRAVMAARRAAAAEPGDPTWLAYAVYGDPRATLQ